MAWAAPFARASARDVVVEYYRSDEIGVLGPDDRARLLAAFRRRVTVVILTSNLGFDFARSNKGLGFSRGTEADDFERLKSQLLAEARSVNVISVLLIVYMPLSFNILSRKPSFI